LLTRFYQHTLVFAQGGPVWDIQLERTYEVFVSYLMTELGEGESVPKVVKTPDRVSYDLVYSKSEYIRFIEYLGKIANEIKVTHKLTTNKFNDI
jgi:hypothetical protein